MYKKHKYLFEKIKKKSEAKYQLKVKLFEGDINKTWLIIKEVLGKKWGICDYFPKTWTTEKVEVTDRKTTANSFNNFFVKIESNLAWKISKSDTNLEAYISKPNSKLHENPLIADEFLKAFKSLKINKAPGFEQIDVSVINQIYNHIKKPLIRIFGDSIKLAVAPEKLKLGKVTPILKSGKSEYLTNCGPISVLPCFSKILERIMYNRLHEYLTKKNFLFDKQFEFRKFHSTEHALIELANRICNSFNKSKHTLVVFIDLSKSFDTVNHNILLKKLKLYGIENSNLKWSARYLSQRKQNNIKILKLVISI